MVGCGAKDPDFIQFVKNGFCLLDDGDGIRRLSEAPVCDGLHSRVMQEMAFQPTALLNKRDIINIQHCRGLQYSFCLCVCLSVCLSVCFPYSGTSRNQAYKQQYQRLQCDTGMKYKKGFFFKTLRSEVMASFTHLE